MPRSANLTILDSALDGVGQTPLIRLDRIAAHEGLKCNLLAKVEYTSAGGSVKDRIAKRMIEQAEKEGRITPGKSVIIEPTSGNTGLGLAMACAIKGYKCVILMPQKMSLEKEVQLRALGAEVVRTPTEANLFSPEGNIGLARRLAREIPGGIILDQYDNENNPLAHELGTGPEIIEAVTSTPSTSAHPSSGKVDVFVGACGTGGTVTGIARAIKKTHNKDCHIIAVDPKGSNMALPVGLNKDDGTTYKVEGIGYAYIPKILTRDPEEINAWVKTIDEPAFKCVGLVNKLEGLLVGGSSGTALSGALTWLKETEEGRTIAETEGMNVVVLMADGVRNYISKDWFLDISMRVESTTLAKEIQHIRTRSYGEDSHWNDEDHITPVVPTWDNPNPTVNGIPWAGAKVVSVVDGDEHVGANGLANVNGLNGHVNGYVNGNGVVVTVNGTGNGMAH